MSDTDTDTAGPEPSQSIMKEEHSIPSAASRAKSSSAGVTLPPVTGFGDDATGAADRVEWFVVEFKSLEEWGGPGLGEGFILSMKSSTGWPKIGFSRFMPVGTRIRFTRTLTDPPNEDHPGRLYATKGETGWITAHGSKEGYWVKTDSWPETFGALPEEVERVL